MNNNIINTSTISVSSSKSVSCIKLAEKLSEAGIKTSIISTVSTLPEIEYGCRITQNVSNKKEILKTWMILKKKYDFYCAHLKIDNVYNGCILKYIEKTSL
jgi:hypothetical protein